MVFQYTVDLLAKMEHIPIEGIQGIGNLLLGLGIFIGSIVQVLNFLHTKTISKRSAANAKNIAELTQNTNGLKDALVVAAGKAEYARGLAETAPEKVVQKIAEIIPEKVAEKVAEKLKDTQ